MKNIISFVFIVFLFSCSQSDSKKEEVITKDQQTDTTKKVVDTIVSKKNDSTSLKRLGNEILVVIKAKDYEKFKGFIHPQLGVRFSSYANVDTSTKSFSGDELIKLAKEKKKIDWGTGYGSPEKLTIDRYFSWIYDVDFINATLKSFNDFHSQGTDLNNIEEAYPGCDVVEFFFPGFDKKYEGMDFRGLRLVFKIKDNTPYLVGIVHDSWTP